MSRGPCIQAIWSPCGEKATRLPKGRAEGGFPPLPLPSSDLRGPSNTLSTCRRSTEKEERVNGGDPRDRGGGEGPAPSKNEGERGAPAHGRSSRLYSRARDPTLNPATTGIRDEQVKTRGTSTAPTAPTATRLPAPRSCPLRASPVDRLLRRKDFHRAKRQRVPVTPLSISTSSPSIFSRPTRIRHSAVISIR